MWGLLQCTAVDYERLPEVRKWMQMAHSTGLLQFQVRPRQNQLFVCDDLKETARDTPNPNPNPNRNPRQKTLFA